MYMQPNVCKRFDTQMRRLLSAVMVEDFSPDICRKWPRVTHGHTASVAILDFVFVTCILFC